MNNMLWVRYARKARDFIKLSLARDIAGGEIDRLLALGDAQKNLKMAIHELQLVRAEFEKNRRTNETTE